MTSLLIFANMPASVPGWVPDIFVTLIKIFVLVNIILGLVSYTVMAERKISAAIQDRVGPNRVGIPLDGVNICSRVAPIGSFVPELAGRYTKIRVLRIAASKHVALTGHQEIASRPHGFLS